MSMQGFQLQVSSDISNPEVRLDKHSQMSWISDIWCIYRIRLLEGDKQGNPDGLARAISELSVCNISPQVPSADTGTQPHG